MKSPEFLYFHVPNTEPKPRPAKKPKLPKLPKVCVWQVVADKFKATCNGLLFFEYLAGVTYCPFCGGKIKVAR